MEEKENQTMLSRKLIHVVCATALLAGTSVSGAFAQLPDRRTVFTFSGPVAIPGATLPAGRYVFRLAEPSTSARVVQVFSADGKQIYGMFFSQPSERPEAARDPEVRFLETAKGMPAAIKTWWYPGERTGFEFVYPKDQARKLAQGSTDSVLTTKAQSTTTEQTNTTELARVSSTGAETSVNATPAPAAPAGTSQQGSVAASSIEFPSATTSAAPRTGNANANANANANPRAQTGTVARNSRRGLPNTASSLPLVGVLGIIALASAALLRLWRGAATSGSLRR